MHERVVVAFDDVYAVGMGVWVRYLRLEKFGRMKILHECERFGFRPLFPEFRFKPQ